MAIGRDFLLEYDTAISSTLWTGFNQAIPITPVTGLKNKGNTYEEHFGSWWRRT